MRMELPPELPQRFDYPKMKDLHNQSSPATEQSYNWIQIFIEENQSKEPTKSNWAINQSKPRKIVDDNNKHMLAYSMPGRIPQTSYHWYLQNI